MERGQPGFLVPSLRRLHHVYSLALRNLAFDADAPAPPSTFFTLSVVAPPAGAAPTAAVATAAAVAATAGSTSAAAADSFAPGARTPPGTLVYRSDLAAATCNPVWAPFEWATVLPEIGEERAAAWAAGGDVEDDDDVTSAASLPAVRLQVFALPPTTADAIGRDARAAAGWSCGEYFPTLRALRALAAATRRCNPRAATSSAGPLPDVAAATSAEFAAVLGAEPLLDVVLDVRELAFLGFDVFDALAALSPPSGPAPGAPVTSSGRTATGGGGVGLDGEYAIDALPLNTLIVVLDDGHYMLPATAAAIRTSHASSGVLSPSAAAAAAGGGGGGGGAAGGGGGRMGAYNFGPGISMGATFGTNSAKHDLRRGFDTMNRAMQLRRDALEARAQRDAAMRQIEALLAAARVVAADAIDTRLMDTALRVAALRATRDKLAAEVAAGA